MNEEEYGEPYPQQQNYAPTGYLPNDRADLLDKIKPEKAVEIIRNKLLGKDFINEVWVDVPALKKNALSEIGAWELSNLMLGVSTINISISKFKDREIKERAKRIAKTAQYMCNANWFSYGIRSTAQLYFVNEIIFSNTLAVLKQADEASIQELMKGTVQENRNINSDKKEPASSRIRRMMGL